MVELFERSESRGSRKRIFRVLIAALSITSCSASNGGGSRAADASGDGVAPDLEGGEDAMVGSGSSGGSMMVAGGSSSSSGSGASSSGSVVAATDAAAPRTYDGTVGMPCTLSTDCEPPGGPGASICSKTAFGVGPLWPTPVCILMRCDPVGSGNGGIRYCDGPPNDPTSPGICLPTTSPPQVNMGTCLPRCEFAVDGGAPTGCQGKNACNLVGAISIATGSVVGEGYCFGGCTTNSDCPSGSQCQVDEGTCVTTLYARTKMIGQACGSADLASTSNACFCDYSAATNQGYCTQSCIVGGPPCPSGYLCDTGETAQISGLAMDGGALPGFAVQNTGMAGICRASCQTGAACPPNSLCSTIDTVGPICAP